eukprot:54906-Rhodomonas_salina.2
MGACIPNLSRSNVAVRHSLHDTVVEAHFERALVGFRRVSIVLVSEVYLPPRTHTPSRPRHRHALAHSTPLTHMPTQPRTLDDRTKRQNEQNSYPSEHECSRLRAQLLPRD